MLRPVLASCVIASVCMFPIDQAQAVPITGSFVGTATLYFHDYDGTGPRTEIEAVTGRFAFEKDFPYRDPAEYDEYSLPEYGPGYVLHKFWTVDMEFEYAGQRDVFEGDNGADYGRTIRLDDLETHQGINLQRGGPYWMAEMDFVAPGGGLFTNFDLDTFDISAIDVAASSAGFSGDIRGGGASVAFSQITFDGYGTIGVPEPAPLGLLAFGTLGLAFAVRKQRPRSVSRID